MLKKIFSKILFTYIALALLISPTIFASPTEETDWWNNEWDFRQEIVIPIDTKDESAQYQPVDINILFEHPCWAKDTEDHSIRVVFQDGKNYNPLDCQIYDLKSSDGELIDSCSIVFLIPKEADGNEKYYVYYDESKKSSPDYTDYVDVSESYYRYDRIPGLLFESSFYQISEKDELIYAINKEGKAYDEKSSQQVIKLKKGTKSVSPKQGEEAASFNLVYYWLSDGGWKLISTAENYIKSQLFVDGNLMTKFGIVSESEDGLLKSTVIYKYYYCPTDDKRIHVHVTHELIGYPLPVGDKIDVTYCVLNSGDIKSHNIEELNFGRIPQYLHYSNEENITKEFKMDQRPESTKWQAVIGKEDDSDLGKSAWASVDDGESCKAHSIIFGSNSIIKNGTGERDGVQLQLYEANAIKLPGVNGYMTSLEFMRNDYENGKTLEPTVPENLVIEFDAEFFTSENGGYPAVSKEAEFFQSLIQFQPDHDGNITDDGEDVNEYNLTTYVHFAPSFPFGSVSSVLGWNIPYISAEIYKDNGFVSSGVVSKLPLSSKIPSNLLELGFIDQIKMIKQIFDWKNFTFFNKVRFPNLFEGKYLIKIFIENPFLRKERKFIGYTIVNLNENKVSHIFCKSEGKASFSIVDQENKGIENAEIYLQVDDMIISENISDSKGNSYLKAPCGLPQKYTLNVTYDGFLIKEKEIYFGRIRKILPLKSKINFSVYDFKINVLDSNEDVPSFDLDFELTSSEMKVPTTITPDTGSDGEYAFYSLYPANYELKIEYNAYEIIEEIKIPDMGSMDIGLNEFNVKILDIWNLPPGENLDVTLRSDDFEKNIVIVGNQLAKDKYYFSNIYPGNYDLKICYKNFELQEKIKIPEQKNIELEFPAEFNFTATVLNSHGNPLKDAKVLMIRDGKEIKVITNENGKVTISLPPGSYVNEIYYNDILISKRNIDISSEKKYTIVTSNEPLLPYFLIVVLTILMIGAGIICYKRKNMILFLKIIAISIAILAIVSPWWEINGESSNYKTSTKLYMMPTKMVELTSNENVSTGEEIPLKDNLKREFDLIFTKIVVEFTLVMDLLPIMILVGIIFIFSSWGVSFYFKRSLPIVILIAAILFFINTIVMFYIAMNELGYITVGSFIGEGSLNIGIPGEIVTESINCSWGPGPGFYLLIISTIISLIIFAIRVKKPIIKLLTKLRRKKI